jgi:hypothetical protein
MNKHDYGGLALAVGSAVKLARDCRLNLPQLVKLLRFAWRLL